MLASDSILRRLPPELEPKQALFIDGIRHAVEIMDLAFTRLRATLTDIATADPKTLVLPAASAHAFLDAWAMVDAIDRFRMLCKQMPNSKPGTLPPGTETLEAVTQPFRNLRNVADHLAGRADYVVSKGGAALGTLTWFTGFKLDPPTGWMCTLRPGTIRQSPEPPPGPITMTVDWPTDHIRLTAGEHEANLSAILPHIALRVRSLERSVHTSLERLGKLDAPCASDMLSKHPIQAAQVQRRPKGPGWILQLGNLIELET